MLRNVFRPESEDVTGGYRRLHNAEYHNLYSLPITWSIVYLTHYIGRFTNHFAWQKVVQPTSLFHFAMSWVLHILFHYKAVNMRLSLH